MNEVLRTARDAGKALDQIKGADGKNLETATEGLKGGFQVGHRIS